MCGTICAQLALRALGVSMMVLAALVWLPLPAIIGFGAPLIAGFLLLRAGGFYDDPRAWTMHVDPWTTAGDFLDTGTYLPSLLYLFFL